MDNYRAWMKRIGLLSRFATVVGAFLIIEGIWGLFSPVVFGVLTSNALDGVAHILLGFLGLVTGLRSGARGFCIFLGMLLLGVDALWFIPATLGLIVRLFNVNQPVAIVNLIVALASLEAAASSRRSASHYDQNLIYRPFDCGLHRNLRCR